MVIPSLPRSSPGPSVFGADLSRVRVHTGSAAQTAAARLGARAFTADDQLYFGAGFWRPQSDSGLALVGHELAHVLQQRRGLSAVDIGGRGDAYEQEADQAGQSFLRVEPARIRSAQGSSSAVQRSEDPGVEATYVGVDDSPYDLPFLGEANTPDELTDLMGSLSGEIGGAPLAFVREDFAMTGAPSGPLVAEGAAPETEQTAGVQTSSLGNRYRCRL